MECVPSPGKSGISGVKSVVIFYTYCKSSYDWIVFLRGEGEADEDPKRLQQLLGVQHHAQTRNAGGSRRALHLPRQVHEPPPATRVASCG